MLLIERHRNRLHRSLVACLAPFAVGARESIPSETTELPSVVVTGTRTERTLRETPVRTEIVAPATFAFAASPKLAEVFEYHSGLRVESNCQSCNTSEIRMLGLQQRYVALLTDGMATFSGLAGVYGIEQIPTSIIDRIEVIKGGASVLYGPGAVAGVVNLVPRDPTHTHADLDFAYSHMEGRRSGNRLNTDTTGVFETVTSDGRLGIVAYGLQSFVQGLDIDGDGFTEVTRRDLYGGGLRTVYRPLPEIRMAIDYFYGFEDRRGGEDAEALDLPDHETFLSEHLESSRHVGLAIWEHEVSPAFDYRVGFSAAHTARESYYGGIGPLGFAPPGTPGHDPLVPARLAARFPQYAPALADPGGVFYRPDWTSALGYGSTDNLLIALEAISNTHLGDRHTVTTGFQYRSESLDDRSGLGRTFRDRYENFGFLAQHAWRPTDPWELVYGLRADKHSEVDPVIVSPRAALKFSPNDRLDLRLGASTGFRAPELFDEDLHISNVGGELVLVRPDPGLRQESSHSFTLGPVWRFAPGWELDGNLFYTGLRDTFFTDLSTDDPDTAGVIEATKINAGGAEVFGAEINLLRRVGWVTAEIGYVEQRSRFDEAQVLLGSPDDPLDPPVSSRRFARTPDRYGVVKLAYDDLRWRAFAAGKLTGPMEVPHVVGDEISGDPVRNEVSRSPYFFTVDLGASRTWKLGDHARMTVLAGVKNVFDDYQRDLDRGPFRDSAYVYGPRFPRTWYAGLKFEF